MSVFLAYDIRGVYPGEVNEELAYKVGLSCAKLFKSKWVIVGRDCRLSSFGLQGALIRGITDFGVSVIDIGICSTPLLYFASKDAPAVMVTASHDPKDYNGFKAVYRGGQPVRADLLNKSVSKPARSKGKVRQVSYLEEYVHFVRTENLPRLKIVCDAGNGCAGVVVPSLFPDFIGINMECNGNFSAHDPNPSVDKNLAQIKAKVKELGADLGIAYDGDCDRVVFVDENGEKVDPSIIGALIASAFRGKKVVYSVNNSRILKETIEKHNFAVPCRVGHFFIKQKMKESNAVFGAEPSGHYYYRENNFCDSGDITIMKILRLLRGKKLSELVAPFEKYYNETLVLPGTEKDIKKVAKKFKKVDKTDGISVSLDEGWFNLRASHTEPVLRLFVEASKGKDLIMIKKKVLKLV